MTNSIAWSSALSAATSLQLNLTNFGSQSGQSMLLLEKQFLSLGPSGQTSRTRLQEQGKEINKSLGNSTSFICFRFKFVSGKIGQLYVFEPM
jgi:hypothetical protein